MHTSAKFKGCVKIRIFYAKWHILLSADASTNRRNEILCGDIIIIKYGKYFFTDKRLRCGKEVMVSTSR